MTSFLKNIKSTLLDSNNKKMPSRHTPNEDPFKRINTWDDGFEYIQGGDRSMDGAPGPMYSPPTPKPTRRSTYEPDHRRERHAYPSPPDSDDGAPRRHRRAARRSPSPPRRRESRREPDRYRDEAPRPRRPDLDAYPTAAPPRARDSPRSYSRSPSPRPRRHDYERDRRHHDGSPSPLRRSNTTRTKAYPDHHRNDYRDSHHRSGPHSSGSSNGDRKYPPRAGDKRPTITRSKTTGAAETGKKAAGIPNLSPKWQKAAAAAFTAGSAAALKMRSQPGNWKGEKGAKVATAALGAAAMDMFLKKHDDDDRERDRDRDRERERDRDRDRERERERDRDRDRNRHGGGGGRKKSEVEMLGGFAADFLADQFQKRTAGRR